MNKWMRKLCFLLCLSLLPLAGCTRSEARVAVFLYDAEDTFLTELVGGLLTRIDEDAEAVVFDAASSQARQNRQIIEELEAGTKYFVINAVDRLACGAIAEKCRSEGASVVFFNREPLESVLRDEQQVFYVGAAAASLGERQADMVAALFGTEFAGGSYDRNGDGIVQILILKGEQGHQDAEKRTDRCVGRLKELGLPLEVLAIEPADWNRERAREAMSRLWPSFGGSAELIFANNDDMALGAVDYFTESGLVSAVANEAGRLPCVLVGVDGTAVGLQAVEDGMLYGTVRNDADRQADAIAAILRRMLSGEGLEEFPYEITNRSCIYIDGGIITRGTAGNNE